MLFKTLISLVLLYSCAAILPPRRRYRMTGHSILPPPASRSFRPIARSRPYPILPQTRSMTIMRHPIAPRTGIHSSRFQNIGSSRYGRGRYRFNDYDDSYNRFDDYDRYDGFDSLPGYNSRGYNSRSRRYSNYRDNDRYDRDRYDRYDRYDSYDHYDRYDDDYNYRRPYMSRSRSGRGFGGFSMTHRRRPYRLGGRNGRFNRYGGGYGYDDDND